jgi:hypothetical protein
VRVNVQPYFMTGTGKLGDMVSYCVVFAFQLTAIGRVTPHGNEHAGIDIERNVGIALSRESRECRARLEEAFLDAAARAKKQLVVLAENEQRPAFYITHAV